MSSAPSQLALFIDADNFRNCDALKQAMQKVFAEGEPVLKHAYGDAVSLKNLEALLAEYGIRPVCNVSVSKNTTDVALAIAAMEAVCRNPAIKTVVICSGDADFAPLAMRLRELGCKVVCYGMHGILFKAAEQFYDEVEAFQVLNEETQPASEPTASLPRLPATAASVPTLATPPAPLPSTKQVLKAWPHLYSGKWQHLAQVVRALREQGFLGLNVRLKEWAEPLSSAFELEPGDKPNQIRYRHAKPAPAQPIPAPPASAKPISSTQPKAKMLAVEKILQAWPDLHDGQWHPLGKVVHALRQQGALAQSSKFNQWRKVLASDFDLQPANAPNQIRYRKHRQLESTQPASAIQASEIVAGSVVAKRFPLPILPEQLHRLRHVLLRLAAKRTSTTLVLIAAPQLMAGNWCAYSAIASSLRQQGVLHPGASLLHVLKNQSHHWEIAHRPGQPQALRYLGHINMHKTP
ncbi:NYN domain-containing protein [Vandammella animalimorsus]|uniref:NYN domain-containing protein n=1 Tax=Vandammella animalimorsus TaxID=2029117 RepID=UPI00325C1196